MFALEPLVEARETLGAVLQGRKLSYELVAIGGGSLLLLGLIDRPTADVDIVGIVDTESRVIVRGMPQPLVEAVGDVGRSLALSPTWLNDEPASLLDFGLPVGFESRAEQRDFASLRIWLPSRLDLIAFKLYASADRGPKDKHFKDLLSLAPTSTDLEFARSWCLTHDSSEAFQHELDGAITELVRHDHSS